MPKFPATALDLRSGETLWERQSRAPPSPRMRLPREVITDIAIVGAGITGAFLAEALSSTGREVVVIDRRAPERGSTAASTSLLQWEIDAPMLAVEDRAGFEAAARLYRRTRRSVGDIARLVHRYGISCDFYQRSSLYLAGSMLDATDLMAECRLRTAAGIGGRIIAAEELFTTEGFRADAALASDGSAEADPVALAAGLIEIAAGRGALVASPVAATEYEQSQTGVSVATDGGSIIRAKKLVLATGYEMPDFVRAPAHRVTSTYVTATAPLAPNRRWPSQALVWEASRPYLYARTTADNRIIAGGEDEPIADAAARDRRLPGKAATIVAKLNGILPRARIDAADLAWAGFFGETTDGLPLIGRVPGRPNTFAAYGYGGNGITFSRVAAEMIAALLAGGRDPDEELFAIDRDG